MIEKEVKRILENLDPVSGTDSGLRRGHVAQLIHTIFKESAFEDSWLEKGELSRYKKFSQHGHVDVSKSQSPLGLQPRGQVIISEVIHGDVLFGFLEQQAEARL
ncbi:hypothetical protein MBLNU459_g4126t1 [Dothideomycetes sp. NU459]